MQTIELEAYSKGWTHDQLWHIPNYPRYDQMGLICFVNNETTIGELNKNYITLVKKQPVGDPIISCFYNMQVEQSWIKRINN